MAALAPWTFSGPAMRQELARQVRETTGLIAEARGRTTLALLPRPRIKIEDVVIHDREGKLLIQAGVLRGDLRLLPAFAGRMEVSSLTLTGPQIEVDLDSKPLSSEGAIARASEARPATREAASADTARLGGVSVRNGTIHLKRDNKDVSTLENVDLTLDWRSLNTPAGLRASFQWAGETVDIAAWVGQPAEVLRGESSPVSMRLDSPSLKLSANGFVSGGGTLNYAGRFAANAPSLQKVTERNGIYIPLPGPLGEMSLAANARASLHSIQLSELHFKLDGNSYEGAIILSSQQGRPSLMGTLASDMLDLGPLLANIPPVGDDERQWNRSPLPRPDLDRTEVDLRVSATRAQVGRVQLRDAGLSILVAKGKAEIAIAEAKAFGGAIKARLSAETAPAGYNVRATAAFARIESGTLLNDAFRSQRFAGEATGEVSLAGQGETIAQVLRTLRGAASIDLINGDIAGIDLEQALRRLEKRPLSIAAEIRNGRTTFDTMHLDLDITEGLASIRKFEAKGAGVAFVVSGSASIARRLLDLTIQARQSGRDATQDGPQLSIDLKGNWDDPRLMVDAQSLIRRSQAAAPLLRGTPQAPADSISLDPKVEEQPPAAPAPATVAQ